MEEQTKARAIAKSLNDPTKTVSSHDEKAYMYKYTILLDAQTGY